MFRITFRWCRILALLLVLLGVGVALYLNQVGLPGFAKRQVVARLEARGWQVGFSRLRWHWYRGIIAESLTLQRAEPGPGPRVRVETAECRIDPRALLDLSIEVRSVELTGGHILLPLPGTNAPAPLLIDQIKGGVNFHRSGCWELRSLQATCLGARFQISGLLTNGAAVRDWKFPGATAAPSSAPAGRRWLEVLEQLQYARAPEVVVLFAGDALDLDRLQAGLRIIMPDVSSPWVRATNAWLSVQRHPPDGTNDAPFASLQFKADAAWTPWGEADGLSGDWLLRMSQPGDLPHHARGHLEMTNARAGAIQARRVHLRGDMDSSPGDPAGRTTTVQVVAGGPTMEGLSADTATAALQWVHDQRDLWPRRLEWRLALEGPRSRWGRAREAAAAGRAEMPARAECGLFATNLAWPDRFTNIAFTAGMELKQWQANGASGALLQLTSHWVAPRLVFEGGSRLYGGQAGIQGTLNADTRKVQFAARTDFDLQQLWPLLRTNRQRWVTNYSWRGAPLAEVSGSFNLPPWTHRPSDWVAAAAPTLSLAGRFEITNGAYRGVPCQQARSSFHFTNSTWFLPDLHVSRPEGVLEADYTENIATREFRARLRSTVDPRALAPAFGHPTVASILNQAALSEPPHVAGEVWGCWTQHQRLGLIARVAATNLTLRGETIKDLVTTVEYTNRFVTLRAPQVRREGEYGTAESIGIDLARHRVFLTNAHGNLNAYAVTRAIGPATARAIEPYVFESSPTIRLNGVVDTRRGGLEDDLHFEVRGGAFRWRQFHLEELAGEVALTGRIVTLTNVHGRMHGGRLAGSARFDGDNPAGSRFAFRLAVADVDMQRLMTDVLQRPNKLEGRLGGELVVTSGILGDDKSWQGHGRVELRDGLVWEIPIFGLFSPVLNAIIPGLGHSQAKEGTATFGITNSVIHTDDLELRAAALRMQYRGWVDFEGRTEGRAEAELLRDLPAVGLLVSKVFWPLTKLFEYRLSGTLNEPKAEPLYVPTKLLLLPLNPVKGLRELLDLEGRQPTAPPPGETDKPPAQP
ncbi:MAG TPA: AsmA-like C-terminal region-containing protein [Methylomirabilota bacterium]|nr:AsmA-like C-terminal region-containing protein [Methylomirabilota bacterium]